MTAKAPGDIERREAVRPSYTTDRERAVLVAILLHAAIIALLIVGLPYLPHHAAPEALHPMAITMVEEPPAEEPAAVPEAALQTTPQATAIAAAPAAQPEQLAEQSATLPPDPGYNPFSSSTQVEIRESPHETPPAPSPSEVEATEGMLGGNGINRPQNGGDANGRGETIGPQTRLPPGGGAGPTRQQGSAVGDALLHPQFLSIRLTGFVNILYTEEMHQFLRRLIQCGVVPVVSQTPDLSVEADVTFTPIGTVQSLRLTNQGEFSDPAYNKAATALLGALTNPTCSYIHLPPQNFPAWHQVHLSFYQHIQTP